MYNENRPAEIVGIGDLRPRRGPHLLGAASQVTPCGHGFEAGADLRPDLRIHEVNPTEKNRGDAHGDHRLDQRGATSASRPLHAGHARAVAK